MLAVGRSPRARVERVSPRPVLVLQHVPWERPGLIAVALEHAGVPVVTRIVLDEDSPDLPDVRELAGLVVMGGSMNADDPRRAGLAAERRLLALAVDADLPTLGICLGMQLLARSLGAVVHAGHGLELGFGPVRLHGSDPVLDPLAGLAVLHWHSDATELPSGATLLASTELTPVQAFRAGSALGLQFHPEIDEALLAAWLAEPAMVEDAQANGVHDLAAQGRNALPAVVGAASIGLASFAAAAAARS